MTRQTAEKLIAKKAIVYWQPTGHDRLGQYTPKIYGRIDSVNFGVLRAITEYGEAKTTIYIDKVHECKKQEDIDWFEKQEANYKENN